VPAQRVRHAIMKAYARMRMQATMLRLTYHGHPRARILAAPCGFFGNMFMTLNGIRVCEAAGVQPEPWWRETSLFYEPGNGDNAWDYYFKPVAVVPEVMPERTLRAREAISFKPNAGAIYPVYPGLDVRASYARCIERNVALQDELRADMDRTVERLFGDAHILGVHVRLTDVMRGFEDRKAASMQQYFEAIDAYTVTQPDCRIFVATDSVQALDALRMRYADRILALDCIRSVDDTSIHGHYDSGVSGSQYQKGLDVIRDAYLLSRVHSLVRVHSSVTAFSLCLNPSLSHQNIRLMG